MTPRAQVWIVALTAVALRLALIALHPALFGGDSVVRLANADKVFLSYNLPLLQSVIFALDRLGGGLAEARFFMAAAGGLAAAGFWRLARSLLGPREAVWASLFFATNPFLTAYSIVPYQEILLLGGLAFAFAFWFEGRTAAASVALGLACLTRYEAWLACPIFLFGEWRRGGWRIAAAVRAIGLYGWAPLAWLAWNLGLTPAGTYAVELRLTIERLWRWIYLGWITAKNTPPPVLALAAVGLWRAWRRGLLRTARWQALAAFLALFLMAVLLSAHGERERPDRFVTAREAHLLLAAAALLAALGLARMGRWRWPVAAAALLWSLVQTERFTAAEANRPPAALAYRAARFLDSHVGASERAVVLAQPVPEELLRRFLDTAARQGGPAAREAAIDELLRLNASPPGYQRILVQTDLDDDRLVSLATFPQQLVPEQQRSAALQPDWIVVWSDFVPANEAEERLAALARQAKPAQTFERGELQISIYRINRRQVRAALR